MLFDLEVSDFEESYKERNLYFKIFAGCLFNELIPENNFPTLFFEKLKSKYEMTCNEFGIFEDQTIKGMLDSLIRDFKNRKIHVSFDYHIRQCAEPAKIKEIKEIFEDIQEPIASLNRGELADILISGTDAFVAIEAKSNEDWKFDKDIVENRKRITLASKIKHKKPIQVLLIKGAKWANSKGQINKDSSHYVKLKDFIREAQSSNFILLLWEDILEIISKQKNASAVSEYLSSILKYQNNWERFKECPFINEQDWSRIYNQIEQYDFKPSSETKFSVLWCDYQNCMFEDICEYKNDSD